MSSTGAVERSLATRSRGGRRRTTALVLLVAAVASAPTLAVTIDALVGGATVGAPDGLADMVVTTLVLLLAVGVGSLLVGGGLAWLVTLYRFPLRDVFSWLLVLPLAVPAYILGFVFLSTFDVGSPLHAAIRGVAGPDAWVPDMRSLPACAVVMTLTLYPYVYLLARAALLEQAPATLEAARVLGAGRLRTLLTVVLPLARPSLAAGLALVMMEVLTDFATVQYFGVKTVSVGVYLTWKGSYDFAAATQLSMLVLAFALAVLVGERLLRGRARFTQGSRAGAGVVAVPLAGARGWAATAACTAALGVAFVLPCGRLALWAVQEAAAGTSLLLDPRFGEYLVNTLVLALVAALACAAAALALVHGSRITGGRLGRSATQVATLGYAVPGAVVGIGVLLVFRWLDTGLERLGTGGTGLVVTGSVAGILYAYLVRFLAPAFQAVDASMAKVSARVTQSALVLGASPRRVLARVHLPLARPGLVIALVLVVIDVVKELPVVLMLRPFGFTTISVWVYQLASENFWAEAALPALLIVAAALAPVVLLFRRAGLVDPRTGGHP
jgi:iron(III) transport system permease protein